MSGASGILSREGAGVEGVWVRVGRRSGMP